MLEETESSRTGLRGATDTSIQPSLHHSDIGLSSRYRVRPRRDGSVDVRVGDGGSLVVSPSVRPSVCGLCLWRVCEQTQWRRGRTNRDVCSFGRLDVGLSEERLFSEDLLFPMRGRGSFERLVSIDGSSGPSRFVLDVNGSEKEGSV